MGVLSLLFARDYILPAISFGLVGLFAIQTVMVYRIRKNPIILEMPIQTENK